MPRVGTGCFNLVPNPRVWSRRGCGQPQEADPTPLSNSLGMEPLLPVSCHICFPFPPANWKAWAWGILSQACGEKADLRIWAWLIKQEGQTGGFGPRFHLPGQPILAPVFGATFDFPNGHLEQTQMSKIGPGPILRLLPTSESREKISESPLGSRSPWHPVPSWPAGSALPLTIEVFWMIWA